MQYEYASRRRPYTYCRDSGFSRATGIDIKIQIAFLLLHFFFIFFTRSHIFSIIIVSFRLLLFLQRVCVFHIASVLQLIFALMYKRMKCGTIIRST